MITIYLDTQHISRIASGSSPLIGALENMRSDVRLAFSLSHVLESLPKEPRFIQQSIDRLSFIMKPSGIGLKPWFDISATEFRAVTATTLSSFEVNVEDILFPEFRARRSEFNRMARDALREDFLKGIPDPNTRRSMQAKIFKLGKFTPAAIKLLKGLQADTLSKVQADAPSLVPLVSDGGLYDFLSGRVSEERFTLLFKNTLINPVSLAQLVGSQELGSILGMSRFLWSQMDAMAGKLSGFMSDLIAIQIRHGIFDYKRIRPGLLATTKSEETLISTVSKLVGKPISVDKLAMMPGTSIFVRSFLQYVLDKADAHVNIDSKNFGSEIKFKRSDLGDLTHLFYAPYMSVFGCDRSMKSVLVRAGVATKHVGSTDEEIIELIAQARSGSLTERDTKAYIP